VADAADIVVVGGGAVGATLALALGAAGRDCAVVEPRAPDHGATPLRPIALAHGSRLVLERVGAWARIQPTTAIERIHVSQRSGFGRATIAAQDLGLAALGYVVDYARVQAAFDAALAGMRARVVRGLVTKITPGHDGASVEYSCGDASATLRARLVVVADGGALREEYPARTVDYAQTAVTATVVAAKPHRNTAFERFTATGPLGVLPYGERCALVWSVPPLRAHELCDAPETAFAAALERDFGRRLGSFSNISNRGAFPLMLKVFNDAGSPRVLRIGNASQMLHPVAGQGLNLGLRDAWELAQLVAFAEQHDPGNAAVLRAYRARRRLDRGSGSWFTHALVRAFSNDLLPLNAARGLGLAALGCMPPARDFLARRMTFGSHA
jgi:2-octaprenyl-6-methoxyphenol hydroxylase